MGETEGETATYDQLVKALDVAAENENIVGVVLKANGLVCGTAKAYEVHEALANFKAKTDKWVYAYGCMPMVIIILKVNTTLLRLPTACLSTLKVW